MASFVREVLSATGQLAEKEFYSGTAARLSSSIADLKAGLSSKIETRYNDFSLSSAEISQQISQLDEVLKEIDTLEHSIQRDIRPGLAEASRDSNELIRQMKELSVSAKAAAQIRKLYEEMEAANDLVELKQFSQATKKLKYIQTAARPQVVLDDQDPDLVRAQESVLTELQTVLENVHFVLGKEWDRLVRIEDLPSGEKEVDRKRIVLGMEDEQQALIGLIRAMHTVDALDYKLKKFGAKLMSNFIPSLTKSHVLSLDDFDEVEHQLHLEFDGKAPPNNPINVIKHLGKLFRFVGEAFNVTVTDELNDRTAMQLLGETFGDRMKDILIRDVLSPAVPSSKSELSKYNDVMSAAETLQRILLECRFLPNDSLEIVKYAQNIDSTFANKRCQAILSQGRDLMKEDLHDAAVVDNKSEAEVDETTMKTMLQLESIDASAEEDLLPLPKGMVLDKSVFVFPKCQVSKTIFRLMDLVKDTLDEACSTDATPFYSGRLLVTAKQLVEMYCDVIPIHHSESLKQFPQLSAIVFNNFFYLAHECITLGLDCVDRIKAPLNARGVTSFAHLVPRLRQTGVEILLKQMQRQRDDIRSVLNDSSTGFGQLTGSELLPAAAEKGIRQILHLLNHLRRLWQEVLPPAIYCRCLGTIANTILDDLVQRVIVLEDIAADAATQLSSLFGALKESIPKLFLIDGRPESSSNDVVRFVRKWTKFGELILILNASLREIEDHWAGGKGLLAIEFSPDEVKRLIRALFQNTDRRAALLAKIKSES